MKKVLEAFLGFGRRLADGLVHENPATLLKRVSTVGAPPIERLLGGWALGPDDGLLVDGRLDLRGSVAASPGTVSLAKTRWVKLDLSRSRLPPLRLHGLRIEGSRFDDADCRGWRLWATKIVDTSFCNADLRSTSLGGVTEDGRNRYVRVDFSGADLRGSGHHSADFEQCDFSGARLDEVDFQGSVFSRCRFQGELSGVQFHRHAFRGEKHPPNEMTEVDFSAARFHFVEFRNLDLLTVRWPDAKDHVPVHDYARVLDRIIDALRARTGPSARAFGAALEHERKWLSPNRNGGVISKADVDDPELFSFIAEFVRADAGAGQKK